MEKNTVQADAAVQFRVSWPGPVGEARRGKGVELELMVPKGPLYKDNSIPIT